MPGSRFRAILFTSYLVSLAVGWYALEHARQAIISELIRPENIQQWQADKLELNRLSQAGGGVQRRPVKSDEPPALILLRDHFRGIAATAWAIVTFLFAFGYLLGRGRYEVPPEANRKPD
jgi:hypothetical protein